MTFLTPLLAGIAAAIAIPALLILYFLKLKRRDLEVSSTLLWKKAIQDFQANAPFQRLRNNILLILQLIALCFALFALAQPEFHGGKGKAAKHVIVIDRSGSMSALDGDPKDKITRLEAAKKQAIEFVNSMQEPGLLDDVGDEAMVVAFDTIADRVMNFTSNKALLRNAINDIQPTDAPTSFVAAFQTARAFTQRQLAENKGIVTTGGAADIHLFSDGRLPDLQQLLTSADAAITAEDKIVYHPVGSSDAWNVGITGLRSDRAFEEPNKLSLFAGIQNTSKEARTCDVQLTIDGRINAVKQVTIPAARMSESTSNDAASGIKLNKQLIPSSAGVVFNIDRASGGVMTISVKPPEGDALEADNYGYIIVPPAKRLSVALVTPGNAFLRKVLGLLKLSKLDVWTPEEAAAKFKNGPPAGYDVFFLDSWLPTVTRADGTTGPGLPPGRYFTFNTVPPPPLGLTDNGVGEATSMISHDTGHPAMRNISFDAFTVNPSRKCTVPPKAGVRVLADGISGPLIFETTDVSTRAICATFDILNTSYWPVDASFVLFIAQGLTYLGANTADTGASLARPGQTIEQLLPAGSSEARVSLPDASRKDLLIASDGRAVYGPLPKVGIYTFSWVGQPGSTDVIAEGRVRRPVAANMLDPQESDLATIAPDQLEAMLPKNIEKAEIKGSIRRLWPWALMAALAFVLLEWYIYNRRVVV